MRSVIFLTLTFSFLTFTMVTSTVIIGGKPRALGQLPYQAFLNITAPSIFSRIYCGGCLISNRFVLTAAHCLYERTGELLPNGEWVRSKSLFTLVSSVNVSLGIADLINESSNQSIFVQGWKNFIIHPEYDPLKRANDIALINVGYVEFNEFIMPVDLPLLRFGYLINTTVEASGWGLDSDNDALHVLQSVKLETAGNWECDIDSTKMCTNGISFGKVVGTCKGDSGGPLVHEDNFHHKYIVGITSYGPTNCLGGQPSIYTRVSEYIFWIAQIMTTNEIQLQS